MPEALSGVAHVPGIQSSHVVGHEERGRGEPEVGEEGVGLVGEGGIAVVERKQQLGMRGAGCGMRHALAELGECESAPPGSG
jgi:hypothetical protein